MLLACLSAAFKLLNSVTDRYKSGKQLLMKSEPLSPLKFQLHNLSYNKQEAMRNFEVCTILITVHILCATGSWVNVKMY